ncbi:hypothetical protein ACFQ3N_00055 [Virgibacillus byunsanensis]|uniref:Uncharacterized protein n=1 Tax=Virgibacillus byunsanensis TaxID=570945 RepID=A0ABW3LI07_9BACI
MSVSRILRWVTGALEALLGIPLLGGAYILSQGWTPLFFMLIFHIITLIWSKKDDEATGGSIIGIITSCIGWIPVVGMVMHIITAIVLFFTAAKGT